MKPKERKLKKLYRIWAVAGALLLAAGCVSEKLPAEDIDVFTVCKEEIAVLQNRSLRPNTREKYEAVQSLLSKVDFNYIRRVETLDAIFSSADARVDNPKSASQVLNFYYQYKDHSVRLVFHRYRNSVIKFEVIEK